MAKLKRASKAKGAQRLPAKGTLGKGVALPKASQVALWFNRLLIMTGAALVIALAIQAYLYLLALPVQQITVTGELEYTQTEKVQEMVQPALAGGFLNADLSRVREQLQALPWIYQAQVRRRWPNALEIHVVEQLPIARWGEGGFLNHEGEVFHTEATAAWAELPRLQGPEEGAAELVDSYQRLSELLAPVGLSIQALIRDERGQLRAELEGDLELIVGDSDFRDRVRRFVALYSRELAARATELKRVDLRYQRGLAVLFREPSQVAGV
jgi:cell division protein FtsQ